MDGNLLVPLLITLIAGLSTMIGALIVLFIKKESKKALAASVSFAAGVMISVSLVSLYPASLNEFLKDYDKIYAIILSVAFLGLGMLVSCKLDLLVPEGKTKNGDKNKENSNLYRVGFMSMIAIALHNFPEGIATFMSSYNDIALGITVAIAITLHNIPEGIGVAIPIYQSTNSRKKALLYTFVAGISEPIGALFALFFLTNFISSFLLGFLFSFISGIMIYIALAELLPESYKHGYEKLVLVSLFVGICVIPLTALI